MKIINKLMVAALMAILLIILAPNKTTAQDEGGYISDQEFYDELSPYGTWISDPDYGNVWVPYAEEGFRPYATQGHWVYTTYGNTWVSDYPWGWAAFHYGRWRYDDYYGWEWIPGSEWAPAWVSWRTGGEYYGWAPLTPSISLDIAFGGNYNIPDNYWVCAPRAYINQPNIYNYYVPHSQVYSIIHRTTVINNTYVYNNQRYISGPRRDEIQRYTSRPVTVYNINNVNRPGAVTVNNRTVNIFRPDIRRSNDARPARVVDGAAYRQQNPNQRIGNGDNNRRVGTSYNHDNASRLANTARNSNPDDRVVRVNNNVSATSYPANNNPAVNQNTDNRFNRNRPANGMAPEQRQQQQQVREQQRQQSRQDRQAPVQQQGAGQVQQNNNQQQNDQISQQRQQAQQQQVQQQNDQMRQQREQQRQQTQQQQQVQQQNDQMRQQREQQRQQTQQQQQVQQQNDQMRQQREQQRQQTQQQQQVQQQQNQQRQQQNDQMRQQREQQRQQSQQQQVQQQQNQQRQQQNDQMRQQREQQRQQAQQQLMQQQNQQRQQQQQINQQRQQQQHMQQRQQRQQQPNPPQQQPAKPQEQRP